MEIGKCGWTEREIRNPESEYPILTNSEIQSQIYNNARGKSSFILLRSPL
jgi:hypothetical protein